MKAWLERSPDIAALFNPAFCGTLLYSAVGAHVGEREVPLPFSLSFIVLPLVLHEPTAEQLPASIRTPMHTWIADHPEIRIGLADRVRGFAPLVRESLMFLLSRGAIRVVDRSILSVSGTVRLTAVGAIGSNELTAAIRRARLVGRLIAYAGRPAAIFASLGLRP